MKTSTSWDPPRSALKAPLWIVGFLLLLSCVPQRAETNRAEGRPSRPSGETRETPARDDAVDPDRLLGDDYPLEVTVSFHAALLHWLDSLAGLPGNGATAGKTIAGHREQYQRLFGKLTATDRQRLEGYGSARLQFARGAGPRRVNDLTLAFFDAPSLEHALRRADDLLPVDHARRLREALRYFAPRYREIWREGERPHAFLARSEPLPLRQELQRFLLDVARFYGVSAQEQPHPCLVLVPVVRGYGTHAQAIDRYLLIELRDGENLADEVAPIVHENAHLLFHRMEEAVHEELRRAASTTDGGERAWELLFEALPTAIAQGVAAERFHTDSWSARQPWYHLDAVDAYAKRIYPRVKQALARGEPLNATLVRELAAMLTSRSP